jgi:hypothetical protein
VAVTQAEVLADLGTGLTEVIEHAPRDSEIPAGANDVNSHLKVDFRS